MGPFGACCLPCRSHRELDAVVVDRQAAVQEQHHAARDAPAAPTAITVIAILSRVCARSTALEIGRGRRAVAEDRNPSPRSRARSCVVVAHEFARGVFVKPPTPATAKPPPNTTHGIQSASGGRPSRLVERNISDSTALVLPPTTTTSIFLRQKAILGARRTVLRPARRGASPCRARHRAAGRRA